MQGEPTSVVQGPGRGGLRAGQRDEGEKLNEGCSDTPGSGLTGQVECNQVKQGEMTFRKRKEH